jgi:hypothetical protein
MLNIVFAVLSSLPAFLCGTALGAVLSYQRAHRELVLGGILMLALRYFVESQGDSVGVSFYAVCWGAFFGVGAICILQIACRNISLLHMKFPFICALSFLTVVITPFQARASAADNISKMCDNGKIDQVIQNNRSAFEQSLLTHAHSISTMYPISSAMSSCAQRLMELISSLPSLENPLDAGNALNSVIMNSVTGASCDTALDSISSVQKSALNVSKICLPLPQFNLSLELPTLNVPSCSGSLEYSALTGFVAPPSAIYTYSQYQQ